GTGDLRLQQRSSTDDEVDFLPRLRRACLGMAGAYHRHPRGFRDPVRTGHVARARRAAGERGTELPVRHTGYRYIEGAADHRHHRNRYTFGYSGARRWRTTVVGDQHGAGGTPVALRDPYRPDADYHHGILPEPRRLCRTSARPREPIRAR